jgi:hypothetical protein
MGSNRVSRPTLWSLDVRYLTTSRTLCRLRLRLHFKLSRRTSYLAQDTSCPISEPAPKRARTVDATGLTLAPQLLLTLHKQEPHELRADTRSSE